jgi:hypothetical protein
MTDCRSESATHGYWCEDQVPSSLNCQLFMLRHAKTSGFAPSLSFPTNFVGSSREPHRALASPPPHFPHGVGIEPKLGNLGQTNGTWYDNTPTRRDQSISISKPDAGFPASSWFITIIHNATLVDNTLGPQHEAIPGAPPLSPPDTWLATLVELPRSIRCKRPRHSPSFQETTWVQPAVVPGSQAAIRRTLRGHGPGSAVPFMGKLAIGPRTRGGCGIWPASTNCLFGLVASVRV